MSGYKISAGAGAVLLAFVAGAQAADVPRYQTAPYAPPPAELVYTKREIFSGWYLRGDLGYSFKSKGTSSTGDTTLVPTPDNAKLSNAFMGGIGAGYKAGWLRADLTGDYIGRSKYTAANGTVNGKIDAFTVMANGYIDFGTWAGFTPYAGAGIGASNVIFSGYENPAATSPMPSTAVPVQRWNVAWAAMLGVSYSLNHNMLLDIGYRHLELGDVSGGPSSQLTVKRFTSDEIRLGIRFLIK